MSVEKKNTSKTPNVQSVEAEVEKGVVKKIATNKKISAKKKTVKPVTRKSVKVNIPKKTKKRTVNKIPSTVIKKNINEPIVKKAKEEIKIEKEPKKELIPEIKTDEPLITMEKIEGIKADREKVLAEEKKNQEEEKMNNNFLRSKNKDRIMVHNDDKKEELVLRGDEMKSILAPRSQKQEMLTEKKEKENIEKIEEAIIDNLGGGRSVGMYRKIALSFVVLTVVLLAVIFYFSFTRVTITLIPNQERVSNNLIFDIYDSENADSVSAMGVPGIVRQITIEDKKEYQASGSNVIGKEVVGKIDIINDYNKNQPLVATTRLISSDGKLFRLKETVNVPVGGLKDVEIYADEAKPEMATGPTTFTIPGLWAGLQDKIYAKNNTDIVYRQKVKKYIDETDIEKGEMDLKQQLLSSVKSKVNDIYKDYDQVIFKIDEQSIKSNADGKINEEKDSFNISMKADVMVVAFDDETASKLAKNKFISSLPENKELLNFDENNIIYSLDNYNNSAGVASVNAAFEGKISLKGDSNIIDVEKILGLNKEQLETYLGDMPEIAGFEIEFYPKFIKKVPKLVDKIDIEIKK